MLNVVEVLEILGAQHVLGGFSHRLPNVIGYSTTQRLSAVIAVTEFCVYVLRVLPTITGSAHIEAAGRDNVGKGAFRPITTGSTASFQKFPHQAWRVDRDDRLVQDFHGHGIAVSLGYG